MTTQAKYTEFDRELRRQRYGRLWARIPIVLTFVSALVVVAGMIARNSYVAGTGAALFAGCVFWNNRGRTSRPK